MITKIKDPRRKGVELRPLNNGFTTSTGWYVEGFTGSDSNEYERADKGEGVQHITHWFIVTDEGLPYD